MGFINLFSNREISIAIWTIIFIAWVVFMAIKDSKIRVSIYQLFKAICNKNIAIFIFITFTYVALSIIFLSNLSLWNWIYLKDVILWFLFIGLPICFNAIVERNKQYLSEIVKNNFKVAVFIEFLVGTFTFSIFTELLLVPISTFIFLLYSVSKLEASYKPAEKFFSFILNTLGLIILFSVGRIAIQNYAELNTLELLVAFSIPITMTIIFLPLSYCFALYSGYEMLFLPLKFRLPNKENRKIVIRKIVRTCRLSITKVEYFKKNYLGKFYSSVTEKEVNKIIKSFKPQYNNERKK